MLEIMVLAICLQSISGPGCSKVADMYYQQNEHLQATVQIQSEEVMKKLKPYESFIVPAAPIAMMAIKQRVGIDITKNWAIKMRVERNDLEVVGYFHTWDF